MKYVVSIMFLFVSAIHLMPLIGVLGLDQLNSLYGLTLANDPNLEILMRHRAVLFGLMGVFMVISAFKVQYQLMALIAGTVSVVTFLFLAWNIGGYNAEIARVFTADLVALGCLVIGAVFLFMQKST